MKTFRGFIKWFLYIIPGIIAVCGISYTLYGVKTISVNVLWEILFSAFATALVTVFAMPTEEDDKIKSYVRLIIHYILLCIIMSFLGAKFGWINFNLYGVLMMALYVGAVYISTCAAYYIIDIKQADKINKKLREKYGDKE